MEYQTECYICGESARLQMLPHRNNSEGVVGIIFVCVDCLPGISGKTVSVSVEEEKERETDCENCQGWGNSCSPDWYADYIRDPEHCEYYEPREETID